MQSPILKTVSIEVVSCLLVVCASVTCAEEPKEPTIPLNTPGIYSLEYSPDGKRLVAGCLQHAEVWSATTGESLLQIKGLKSPTFSPNGKRIAGVMDQKACIFDADGRLKQKYAPNAKWKPGKVHFSPDGMFLSVDAVGTNVGLFSVHIWNTKTDKLHLTFAESGLVVFSPDGKRLALQHVAVPAQAADHISFYAVADGKLKDKITIGLAATRAESIVRALAYSPDGKMLAMVREGSAQVWDLKKREPKFRFNVLPADVRFSPNGEFLLVVNQKTWTEFQIVIIETKSWKQVSQLDYTQFAFSPDGNQLAIVRRHKGKSEIAQVPLASLVTNP